MELWGLSKHFEKHPPFRYRKLDHACAEWIFLFRMKLLVEI